MVHISKCALVKELMLLNLPTLFEQLTFIVKIIKKMQLIYNFFLHFTLINVIILL